MGSEKTPQAQALKRGDIFWATLHPRSGSGQWGRRPVVVVSHDGFNQAPAWSTVIVVPVSTSKAQEERGPTSVSLPSGAGGLKRPSFALCHQVTTVERSKLTRRLGTLHPGFLTAVDGGLKAALDLD